MAKIVAVEGLRQLGAAMRELTSEINKRSAWKATVAAAQVMRKEIRGRAPVDTGNLRNNIIVKRLPKSETDLTAETIVTVRKGRTKAQVKSRTREARYALYLEFGTVKMSARPFIRPGFEAAKGQSAAQMITVLAEQITKANRNVP